MGRVIGICHRVKHTTDGAARPTLLAILDGDKTTMLGLPTEDDELSFVREGLIPGDKIAMMLGGSGDRFAFALANRGLEIGASVFRIPPHKFAELFGKDRDKDEDVMLLARLLHAVSAEDSPFYLVLTRDLDVIRLREAYYARMDAMKARIACEARLRARLIGHIFCSIDGYYPEGTIEEEYAKIKASDPIFRALGKEEEQRNKELTKACKNLDVYNEIFAPIEGMGSAIAAGIISSIVDIRRFPTDSKFRAYCGLHVPDGKFPRRRRKTKNDETNPNNWNPGLRQAFYLLGDQFNRRPNSPWGQRLREVKAEYRQKHPEVTTVDGKQRYTKGHIHKMAIWKTLGEFAVWLYAEWTAFAM